MKVCIAIATTGSRPRELVSCIRTALNQRLPEAIVLKVAVVVNSTTLLPEKLRAEILSLEAADNVVFLQETTQAIPFARNCALNYMLENNYDYGGFLDDDTEAKSDWLISHLERLQDTGYEASTGPQIPVFTNNVDSIIRNAKIHQERRLEDGSLCKWAATNNVVFLISFVNKKALFFNEKFLTGGSDKEFFYKFTIAGGRLVWTKDAIVTEVVIPSRLSTKWARQRAYRYGTTGFKIEQSRNNIILAVLICLFKGSVYFLMGFVTYILSYVFLKFNRLDSECNMAHGAGFILGMGKVFRLKQYA